MPSWLCGVLDDMWQLRRIILIVRHKDLLHTKNLGSAPVIFFLFRAFAANVFPATGTHEIDQRIINIIWICHNLTLQQLRAHVVFSMALITNAMFPPLLAEIFHRNVIATAIWAFMIGNPGFNPHIIWKHTAYFRS